MPGSSGGAPACVSMLRRAVARRDRRRAGRLAREQEARRAVAADRIEVDDGNDRRPAAGQGCRSPGRVRTPPRRAGRPGRRRWRGRRACARASLRRRSAPARWSAQSRRRCRSLRRVEVVPVCRDDDRLRRAAGGDGDEVDELATPEPWDVRSERLPVDPQAVVREAVRDPPRRIVRSRRSRHSVRELLGELPGELASPSGRRTTGRAAVAGAGSAVPR